MATNASPRGPETERSPIFAAFVDPRTRVALVAALALVIQAVLAKNVLDVELDFGSQFSALWVFIVYQVSNDRSRLAELGAMAVIVAVTAAVLLLYGFS
jgi:hypothetical protein